MELTVGYVAGAIAAGFFVATQLSALALALILSWRLHDNSSAATWTVAATSLLGSHWTRLANSDSNFGGGVSRGVLWSTRMALATAGILAIGSVVTPFGLYSTLQPSRPVQMTMQYARDPSPFGYGTPLRTNLAWSRFCWGYVFDPCPLTDDVMVEIWKGNSNATFDYPNGHNMTVPPKLIEIYGYNASATVANFFDIQWRRLTTTRDETGVNNNGETYAIANSRRIDTLVQNNALQPIEGLVVDTQRGGIGFRNHSVPSDGQSAFRHGMKWDEDLLFVEPDTVCVDTNLTLDFTVTDGNNDTAGVGNNTMWLTDRGGFVDLDYSHIPWPDLSNPQANPDLWGRAYMGAWYHNALVAMFFNVTNPNRKDIGGPGAFVYFNATHNATYVLNMNKNSAIMEMNSMKLTTDYGNYLQKMSGVDDPLSFNPHGISRSDFMEIIRSRANISNLAMACGQMRPVARRVSPGSPADFDVGSVWSQKIYSCATASRALIKTVTFSYNRTDGAFDSFRVERIREATLPEPPLWGVEDTANRYDTTSFNPIWGLVADKYADHDKYPNISTVRQPWLYLPGYTGYLGARTFSYGSHENLPGADFAVGSMNSAYVQDSDYTGGTDYSGISSLAMYSRWQTLGANAVDAALIPNLIFTDIAASLVVGTKSAADGSFPSRTVTPWKVAIRYRLLYAIPAFVGAALLLCIILVAVGAVIIGGAGLQRIRHHLNVVAPGRIYTLFLNDEERGSGLVRDAEAENPRSVLRLPAGDWHKEFGSKRIDLSGDVPTTVPEKKNSVQT